MSSCPIPIEFPQSTYFCLASFVCWSSAFFLLAAFAFKFRSQWRNFLEDWVGLILHSPRCLLPSSAKANWIIFCHFVLDLRLWWGNSTDNLFLVSRHTFPVAIFICCLLGSLLSLSSSAMGRLSGLRLMYTCILLCLRLFYVIFLCDMNSSCDDVHVVTMFVVSISYSLSSLALLVKLEEASIEDPTILIHIGSGASVVGIWRLFCTRTFKWPLVMDSMLRAGWTPCRPQGRPASLTGEPCCAIADVADELLWTSTRMAPLLPDDFFLQIVHLLITVTLVILGRNF